jgi:hypothetical protein
MVSSKNRFVQHVGENVTMGSLDENWLSVELDQIEGEIQRWSIGLRESFQALQDSTQRDSDFKASDFSVMET